MTATRKRKRRRWGAAVTVVIVAALAAGGLIVRDQLTVQESSAEAEAFASPLVTLCQQDEQTARAAGADCERAAQVAAGDSVDARGVVGTSLVDGILVVTYSDGSSTRVGKVDGDDGDAGRGIETTTIENGRLIILFTDGSRADHGPIVGPPGVGISGVAAVNGRLTVTLTDGKVLDAGPLPEGRPGRDGKDAPPLQRQTFAYTDGTSRVCERDPATPEDAPVMRCGDRLNPDGTPAATSSTPAGETSGGG